MVKVFDLSNCPDGGGQSKKRAQSPRKKTRKGEKRKMMKQKTERCHQGDGRRAKEQKGLVESGVAKKAAEAAVKKQNR